MSWDAGPCGAPRMRMRPAVNFRPLAGGQDMRPLSYRGAPLIAFPTPPIPFLSPLPTQSFEYTDDDEPEADDTEVALENAYYNAKGLRETDLGEAEAAFEEVLRMEAEEIASGGDGDGDG